MRSETEVGGPGAVRSGRMSLERFVQQIRFEGFEAEDLRPELHGYPFHDRPLDAYATRLPEEDTELHARLSVPCSFPRMATFAIGAVLNRAVAELPEGHAYVNVGVWNGFTFLAGCAGNPHQRCVGVDDFSEFGGPRQEFMARFERARSTRHEFYDMDYRRYFSEVHEGPIGLYLYDGSHDYEHQLQGLHSAEPFFTRGTRVFVDDTNLASARKATFEFIARSPFRYRVLFDLKTARNGHPTFWNGFLGLEREDP